MTAEEADTLIGKCCCWFDISTAPWDKTARAELKVLFLQLDYKSAEKALREQSIWGQKKDAALKMPAVFSMLHQRVKWAE